MRLKSCTRQAGFSLLEIMVAFAILAMSLGVLLSIFSGGLRSAMLAEEYQEALAIAESQMAKAGVEIELAPGQISGEELGKYAWAVIITPFELLQTKQSNAQVQTPSVLQPQQAQTSNLAAFSVQVSVTWQEGDDAREVVLNSVRLGSAQVNAKR